MESQIDTWRHKQAVRELHEAFMPTLSIESMRQIERLCTRFEECHGEAGTPFLTTVDRLLGEVDDDAQAVLLTELVAIDAELRRSQGQEIAVADYQPLIDRDDLPFRSSDAIQVLDADRSRGEDEPESSRYRFIKKVGSGGNGDVWRVEDSVGQRTLAVKRLRDTHRDDASAKARLNREALLTGRLQHPGIPPIYDHGELDDAASFFSMKLVEGETFESILKARAPDDDVSRFLGIFEQIAQTVAYAHTQGVIHRDLKPQNIMVGAFGEVQVMDWGMAKSITNATANSRDARQAKTATATIPIQPISLEDTTRASEDDSWDESGQSLTMAGDILGTPAYMSPEQARGQGKTLDARSDVFTLGAILFEILTHQRLHRDGGVAESLRRSSLGEFESSLKALRDSQVHDEWKSLCKRCLSVDPANRPSNAGEVSEAVTRQLLGVEQRARQSELARHESGVRAAEDRKRRRLQMRAAMLIAAVSILGAGIAFWQRRIAVDAGNRTSQALKLADQRFDQAQSVVEEFLTRVADDEGVLTRTPGAQAIRRDLMLKAVDYYEELDAESKRLPEFRFKMAQTYLRLAEVMLLLSPGGDDLVHNADQAIKICGALSSEFPGQHDYLACKTDAVELKCEALKSSLRYERAIPVAHHAEQLAASLVQARGTSDDRFRHARCIGSLARVQERCNQTDGCQTKFEKAIAIATPIQAASPTNANYARDLATLHTDLGSLFGWRHGEWEQTRQHFVSAVKFQQLAVDLQPTRSDWRGELANEQMRLGMALSHVNQIEQAEAAFRNAIETHERVVQENPLDIDLRRRFCYALGNFATFCLRDLDRPAETNDLLLRSVEQAEKLFEAEPKVDIHVDWVSDTLTSAIETQIRIATSRSASDSTLAPPSASEIARPLLNRLLSACRRRLAVDPDSDKHQRIVAFWSAMLDDTDDESLLTMTARVDGDTPSLRQLDQRWIEARVLALIRNDRQTDAIEMLDACTAEEPTPVRLLLESLARAESDPDAADSLRQRARAHKFKKMEVRVDYRLLMERANATLRNE